MSSLVLGDNVVNGTLTGFEVKNGWHKFSITVPGWEYPVKADTKKPDVINAALALVGQEVSVKINRSESDNVNPNNNQPYINSYLNEIGALSAGAIANPTPGQPAQQGQAQQPQGSLHHTFREEDPVRALRIARMNGAQHAVGMLAAGILPESQQNMSGLVEVAEAWVAYTLQGPQRFGVSAFNAPPTEQPAQEEPPPPEEPPMPVHPVTGELLPEGYTVDANGNVFDASGFPAAF
jgi:hypothetical protein